MGDSLGMIGLLAPVTALVSQRVIIDIAMYFGLFFIVALSLNFQYGSAGVPNMACAVSVAVGGYTVSAIVTRLIYWVGVEAGLDILPLGNRTHWAFHNNSLNVDVMNEYIQTHAPLGIAMFVFSLALGFAAGWALGYVLYLPAIRLRATYLIISTFVMGNIASFLARSIIPIAGGSMGMFVPNVLAWYPGDRTIPLAIVTLTVGIIVYIILRTMLNSPYGRLVRAVRESDISMNSVGKNATAIRRNVVMFGSGITALSGVLLSYYYSFVIELNFTRVTWTYWPWLMVLVGGPGSNAGTFIGVALIIAFRRLIIFFKEPLSHLIWYPVVIFEQQLMGLLFLVVLATRRKGLIPEKPLRINGVDYKRPMMDEGLEG
jgi:branched-chain amino acid transport system permease protein